MNQEERHVIGLAIQRAILKARPDWTTYVGDKPGEHLSFLCGQLAGIAREEQRKENLRESAI